MVEIDIQQSLYEKYKQLIRERFLSDDVSAHVEGLIRQELRKLCAPGFDRDILCACKTRQQLEMDISAFTRGVDWHDHSNFESKFLCVDVDNMKRYLDIYGLTAGDIALKSIGDQLVSQYGADDVYRFGGDEFVAHLKQREYVPLNVPPNIVLKHSIVKVSVTRSQHHYQFVNRELFFQMEKGIVQSTPGGYEIVYES